MKKGCKTKLAKDQWWNFCGETDMGQTAPALCKNCGGDFEVADKEQAIKDKNKQMNCAR